jgi:hypothetical protein
MTIGERIETASSYLLCLAGPSRVCVSDGRPTSTSVEVHLPGQTRDGVVVSGYPGLKYHGPEDLCQALHPKLSRYVIAFFLCLWR